MTTGSQGAALPVFELGLDAIESTCLLVNEMVDGEVLALQDAQVLLLALSAHAPWHSPSRSECKGRCWPPLSMAPRTAERAVCIACMQVHLAVGAHASLLNPSHGEWEPVLEPWHVALDLRKLQALPDGKPESTSAGAASEEASGSESRSPLKVSRSPSSNAATPSTPGGAAAASSASSEFHVRLLSTEALELNLSPALITTAHSLLHVLTFATDAAAQSEAALAALRRSMGTVSANTVALRNCTELPMAFLTSADEQLRPIAAGAEVSFTDALAPSYEAFGQRSTTFAETSESLEFVHAARHNQVGALDLRLASHNLRCSPSTSRRHSFSPLDSPSIFPDLPSTSPRSSTSSSSCSSAMLTSTRTTLSGAPRCTRRASTATTTSSDCCSARAQTSKCRRSTALS